MARALLLLLLIAFATAAPGQAPAPEAEDWIRPEAVPARADALAGVLEEARPSAAQLELLAQVEADLAERSPRLEALRSRVEEALVRSAPINQLADLQLEVDAELKALADWHERLQDEAQRLTRLLAEMARSQALWSATQRRRETIEAGEVVVRRVRGSLDAIASSGEELRAWRGRVLALDDRLVELRGGAGSALSRLEESTAERSTTLLVPDRAPLWQGRLPRRLREELPQAPQALADLYAETDRYTRSDGRPLVVQLVLALLFGLAIRRASHEAPRRAAGDPGLSTALRVLERPFSIGLLLALVLTAALHPLAPRRFTQLLGLIALLPAARIISHVSPQTSRALLGGFFALLVLDRLALAFEGLPTLSQLALLLQLALGLLLSASVLRRGVVPWDSRWVRVGVRLVAASLAAALLAEIGGWRQLAALLTRITIVPALLAVYVWTAAVALEALVVIVLRTSGVRIAPAATAAVLERRGRRLVRWLGAAFWIWFALGGVGLREPVLSGVRSVLEAGISVGALSLTVGGVLAFILTIVAAPMVARFIEFVLERGVYPRARLPRGLPYALSTLARYAVYSLAFVAALAAAGVELSQLSILLGGLGVGIGLGLQDVVKNFAAGLTLLFERRVHVGDVVQIPSHQIFGRVREIGLRASMVRNFDGAEVVVPNSDLVSTAVTNWTLSDPLRRIELPVGVAYGSDLEQVIGLLLEVAREHDEILQEPAPQALFHGFGESSLDFLFRAWTDSDYDRTLAIRSDLALATHRKLRDAGVQIPFPQHDLHLASVSPEVRSALGRAERGE